MQPLHGMRVAGLTLVLGVAFSPQVRADPLERACKFGDPFSCLEAEPSLAHATRACQLGQPRGCLAGAQLLLDAPIARPAQALTFFDKACALGDRLGCYQSGKLRADPDLTLIDYPRAFLSLYKSCRQGYGPACTVVGGLHAEGAGTPKDQLRAAIAFRNGCERSDPEACLLLGRRLTQRAEAAAAYQQACRLGQPEGCAKVDQLARHGVKPAPRLRPLLDPMVERERLLRSLPGGRNPVPFGEVTSCPSPGPEPACASGDLAVCQQSADLQQNGGDGEAAWCMRRQACERGDGYACEQLGYAHEGGALPSSPVAALGWYERGCAEGSAAACASAVRLIDSVEATSTANQRATRKLDLTVRGCALDDAGDCLLVYKELLSRVADPVLAHRAWITLGRWCETEQRDGPACSVVEDRRKAIVLERDCHQGKAGACREAAGLFLDPQRESALLGRACALGDCESCVGRKTVEGVRLAVSRASQRKAAKVCPAQCQAAPADGPEPKACLYGVRALVALGGKANERKALRLAEQQCRRGFTCSLLAELFVVAEPLSAASEKRIGAVIDRACAAQKPGTCQARAELAQIKPARELCHQADIDGCLKWGDQLKLSNVELPQISLAWDRACRLGSNLGCVRHWASLGSGSSHDPQELEWSHRLAAEACEAGELPICIELANHLKFRTADPQALEELKRVGEKVVVALEGECDAGNAGSCERAAVFLQFKKELQGEARARELYRKACEHGAGGRCLELAEQSAKQKDLARVAEYGSKACVAGSTAGCRILIQHRPELTPEGRAQADRAIGLACGKKVPGACGLAADAGLPVLFEAPAVPIPLSRT